MALHHDTGRTEKIIAQFRLKSLHAILESRIPSMRPRDLSGDLASGSRGRKGDKWFNLTLGDSPVALEEMNLRHKNVMDPMIIDVKLIHEVPSHSSGDDMLNSSPVMTDTILERWVIHHDHEHLKPLFQSGDGSASDIKIYKRSIILLRSIHSTLRFLPAFMVFKKLISSNQGCNFSIGYRVSSFCEPFSRAKEEEMRNFVFVPVETPLGRLNVSVTYHPTLSDFNLETSTLLPHIIPDYVPSPAADPLKVYPTMDRNLRSISYPTRGSQSPSSPLHRPHSWTSGIHRASHVAHPPFSVSPPIHPKQPMPSDFHPSSPNPYGRKSSNYRPSIHKKGTSYDEFRLSPPLSPSPSPSPSPSSPAHLSCGSPFQNRLHSETAPVSIPLPLGGTRTRNLTPNSSDPNRHLLPPMSPRSTRADLSSQNSPLESRSFRKLDATRPGDFIGPKAFKDGKDDSGRFSGVFSSCGSPRVGFSRSSSRLSFQDDIDDCEFSWPFVVDDVDTSDSQTRTPTGMDAPESNNPSSSTRQSQDAAVGMLVQMLRTAAPLRQDQSLLAQSSISEFSGESNASGLFF